MQNWQATCSIIRKIKKQILLNEELGLPADYESVAASIIPQEIEWHKRATTINVLVNDAYNEVMGTVAGHHYFITIRPRPETEFLEFFRLVNKFVNRKVIKDYHLTFEQKNELGSGEGFHAHIVATTTQRSKGECLRDAMSTFKDVAAENCIDVQTTKNPKDIINNYLILYESKDEHKESTKVGDSIWRDKMGLENIYNNDLPTLLSIKSEDSNVISFT